MKTNAEKNYIYGITALAGIAAIISLVAQYGFYLSPGALDAFRHVDLGIALLFVLSYFLRILTSSEKWEEIRSTPFETLLFIIFVLSLLLEGISKWQFLSSDLAINYIKIYYIVVQFYLVSNMLISLARSRENWLFISLHPSRVFLFSFFIVIVLGVLLLKLPRATYNDISLVDAIFISTSAVCVTGLTPVNVVNTFTPVGQGVILFLFQIGGLGIVTLTSFIALLFQQKGSFRLRDQVILMEVLDDTNLSKLGDILRSIIRLTLFFELVGAVILWFRWGNFGLSPGRRIFTAVFHSVSAYCNAGFSNLQNGLESVGYNRDPATMVTVMILIILGGLGFYTLKDVLIERKSRSDNIHRFTLQTRMILGISGALILVGGIFVTAVQWTSWGDMPGWLKVMNGFFTSVTSRTAGFSTINVGALSLPSIILIMLLMYIGAAPNSTAGGIKVTTFGALLAASWAFIRGKDRVEIGWNTLPMTTIRRSYIVLLVSLVLIFTAMLLLSFVEEAAFTDLLFEVVSAFGTVGLSRGVTPFLSEFGKLVITVVMFMGRVGLYTLAIAIGRETAVRHNYEYPETNIMVG
ncbi:MAG: potassium transporter TrkG [Fidelibacterota bacterium]